MPLCFRETIGEAGVRRFTAAIAHQGRLASSGGSSRNANDERNPESSKFEPVSQEQLISLRHLGFSIVLTLVIRTSSLLFLSRNDPCPQIAPLASLGYCLPAVAVGLH